jgi:hypothetical protein
LLLLLPLFPFIYLAAWAVRRKSRLKGNKPTIPDGAVALSRLAWVALCPVVGVVVVVLGADMSLVPIGAGVVVLLVSGIAFTLLMPRLKREELLTSKEAAVTLIVSSLWILGFPVLSLVFDHGVRAATLVLIVELDGFVLAAATLSAKMVGQRVRVGLSCGAVLCAAAVVMSTSGLVNGLIGNDFFGSTLFCLLAGLAAYPLIVSAMRAWLLHDLAIALVALAASLLAMYPLAEVQHLWILGTPGDYVLNPTSFQVAVLITLRLVFCGALVGFLAWLGKQSMTYHVPAVIAAVVTVVLAFSSPAGQPTPLNVVALVVEVVGLLIIVPTDRLKDALRMSMRIPAEHATAMLAEAKRRLMLQSTKDIIKGTRRKLAAGEFTSTELNELSGQLDTYAVPPPTGGSDDPPLGSCGGQTAWRNGWVAGRFALYISLPFSAYEWWRLLQQSGGLFTESPTIVMVDYIRNVGRWVAYGWAYGYLYPIFRGRTPITKALGLMCVLLGPEILTIVDNQPSSAALRLAILVRVGEVVIFCMLLGLAWEWQLTRDAGMPWIRIRDFRRLGSLAAPVTSVLVAVATVVATTLTTQALQPVFQPPPAAAQPQSTGTH